MGGFLLENSGQMARFAGKSRSPAKFRGEIAAFSPFFVPFNDYYSEPRLRLRSRQFLEPNSRAKPAHHYRQTGAGRVRAPRRRAASAASGARAMKAARISIAQISFASCEGTTNSDCVWQAEEARVRGGCIQINTE
jgi:hypothetical protein